MLWWHSLCASARQGCWPTLSSSRATSPLPTGCVRQESRCCGGARYARESTGARMGGARSGQALNEIAWNDCGTTQDEATLSFCCRNADFWRRYAMRKTWRGPRCRHPLCGTRGPLQVRSASVHRVGEAKLASRRPLRAVRTNAGKYPPPTEIPSAICPAGSLRRSGAVNPDPALASIAGEKGLGNLRLADRQGAFVLGLGPRPRAAGGRVALLSPRQCLRRRTAAG